MNILPVNNNRTSFTGYVHPEVNLEIQNKAIGYMRYLTDTATKRGEKVDNELFENIILNVREMITDLSDFMSKTHKKTSLNIFKDKFGQKHLVVAQPGFVFKPVNIKTDGITSVDGSHSIYGRTLVDMNGENVITDMWNFIKGFIKRDPSDIDNSIFIKALEELKEAVKSPFIHQKIRRDETEAIIKFAQEANIPSAKEKTEGAITQAKKEKSERIERATSVPKKLEQENEKTFLSAISRLTSSKLPVEEL